MLRRCIKPRAAIRTVRCLGTTALGYAPLQERPAFCGAPVTAVAGAGVFHRTPMLLGQKKTARGMPPRPTTDKHRFD